MKPYDGIEVWFYFILAALAITAIAILVFAFRTEKTEKAEEDKTIAKSIRFRKYGLFAGFAVVASIATLVGFIAQPVSLENYRSQMVQTIESNGVKVIEGFVDPSIPLTPGSHAKFVAESNTGAIRCRANAGDAGTEVQFMCQDLKDKEKDFTIPLSEVNKKSASSDKAGKTTATPVPTVKPTKK